ncbi:MAG TPA: DUF4118 domain-containing protein, partial [Pirellulales bacterium]
MSALGSLTEWRSVRHTTWKLYLATLAIVIGCSLLGWGASRLGLTSANIVMIFLAGVTLVAARFGHWPAVLAAVLSVLIFDYFFVPPMLSFAPSDTQYFVDLAVMLGIGLLISELTSRLQSQLQASRQQEQITAQLYQMTRQLSELAGADFLIATAGRQLKQIFDGDVVIYLRDSAGELQAKFGQEVPWRELPANVRAANFTGESDAVAEIGADHGTDASALFVPMVGSSRTLGVLGLRPTSEVGSFDTERQRLLETCASLIALSLERDQSFLAAQQAQLQVQSEQFRNYVLSSVSHDLRTPLAMIAVTASNLLEDSTEGTWDKKREMLRTVVDESHRLSRQMENLLRHARLTSGNLVLNREWQVLEELVGIALTRLHDELGDRNVRANIDRDFPLLWVAGDLMEQ